MSIVIMAVIAIVVVVFAELVNVIVALIMIIIVIIAVKGFIAKIHVLNYVPVSKVAPVNKILFVDF